MNLTHSSRGGHAPRNRLCGPLPAESERSFKTQGRDKCTEVREVGCGKTLSPWEHTPLNWPQLRDSEHLQRHQTFHTHVHTRMHTPHSLWERDPSTERTDQRRQRTHKGKVDPGPGPGAGKEPLWRNSLEFHEPAAEVNSSVLTSVPGYGKVNSRGSREKVWRDLVSSV